jgi:hypothetical protein
MTADDYFAIQNLVHGYARALDRGDFQAVGAFFAHADVYAEGTLLARSDAAAVTREWTRYTRRFDDGTPHTRHVTTNLIIEPDGAGRAGAESYFMVFQQTGGLPLQPIIGGDYADRFECAHGVWRFRERRIRTALVGDLSQHLLVAL